MSGPRPISIWFVAGALCLAASLSGAAPGPAGQTTGDQGAPRGDAGIEFAFPTRTLHWAGESSKKEEDSSDESGASKNEGGKSGGKESDSIFKK